MSYQDKSLSHLAYLALEQEIITHRLKPGQMVNERDLIALSGHGRTPVREAIQKLSWQGLIHIRPRVGLQITHIDAPDYRKIMAVRLQIEPMASRLAAEAATPEQRAVLLSCAEAMTNAAGSGDIDRFMAADKKFDEVVEAACPNPFLVQALTPLTVHARRLWFANANAEKMDLSLTLHVAIIRAIQKGDGDGADAATRRLIETLTEA